MSPPCRFSGPVMRIRTERGDNSEARAGTESVNIESECSVPGLIAGLVLNTHFSLMLLPH